MQRRYTCFVLAAIAGCASPSDDTTTIAHTFDPCTPPSVIAAGTASAAQTDGIAAALALWRTHGAPTLGTSPGDTLGVRFETAGGPFHGLYDDQAVVIDINNDVTDPAMLAVVIAHELGHAFGLHHVSPDVRQSVMNPGNLSVTPTDDDRKALEALWGVCDEGAGVRPSNTER